jgi:hypothetical protein
MEIDGRGFEVPHGVEQMPVVGFVDAHHRLHRLRRQTHLVAGDGGTGVEPLADVDELDLVGIHHVEARVIVGWPIDRGRGPLSCP